MYELEMHEVSEEFARCWHVAKQHIQKQMQDPLKMWLKANLSPPFLEHLSFRLGNQLFFVRIEDEEDELEIPGSRAGLLSIADGCNGYPCLMPMRRISGGWVPLGLSWGLINSRTNKNIDPLALVSDERIEMTDWELQDFAVQIVRDELRKNGRKLISWQSNPTVDPSIWFAGDSSAEWVVVRAARYPDKQASAPANWNQIAEQRAQYGEKGHFASVCFANAEDASNPTGHLRPTPLWRGHGLMCNFAGLATVS